MSKEQLVDHQLKTGWVTMHREKVESGGYRIDFEVQMDLEYPSAEIFEQVILGLTDTEKSWIWPAEHQWSPERPEGGVREGCILRMTYMVPRFDNPKIAPKPITYSYTLPQYRPEDCMFEYRSIDHPLKGGAVMHVLDLGESHCRVSWKGGYLQDPSQEIVINSLIKHVPFLYTEMEEKILAGKSAG